MNRRLQDNDFDSPDWIDVYNPGSTEVNRKGYGISDDPKDGHKWTIIPPCGYVIVFASG